MSHHSMALEPGTLVTQNVRLVSLLGQGGMGSVWRADHLTLDVQVAVKFISAETAKSDVGLRDRFRREASIAAKIKSPHTVQIFDHGKMEDDTPFIVMELLEGQSLGDRLEGECLDAAEVTVLVSQIAEVLTRAHEMGIVHRDLKPDNLFLIDSGYELFVKMLDFGVAKQTSLPQKSMTTTGAMVGTPVYMSPELIESAKDADRYADLWALAVVAYEALTGEVPFNGETLGALCIAIAQADFPPPSQLRPDLPGELDGWFSRALAKSPAARFATANEMAEAFAAAARGATLSSEERNLRGSRVGHRQTPGSMRWSSPGSGHVELDVQGEGDGAADDDSLPHSATVSAAGAVLEATLASPADGSAVVEDASTGPDMHRSGPSVDEAGGPRAITFGPTITAATNAKSSGRSALVAVLGVLVVAAIAATVMMSRDQGELASDGVPAASAALIPSNDETVEPQPPPLPSASSPAAARTSEPTAASSGSAEEPIAVAPPVPTTPLGTKPLSTTARPAVSASAAPVGLDHCFYLENGKLVFRADRPECKKSAP